MTPFGDYVLGWNAYHGDTMDGPKPEPRKYVDAVYENEGWWFALETHARDYQKYYLRKEGDDGPQHPPQDG